MMEDKPGQFEGREWEISTPGASPVGKGKQDLEALVWLAGGEMGRMEEVMLERSDVPRYRDCC